MIRFANALWLLFMLVAASASAAERPRLAIPG
jgi:hypothetical protein